MPTETIVAMFETDGQAERAVSALVDAGIPRTNIGRHATDMFDDEEDGPATISTQTTGGPGSMWSWLTGSHDKHPSHHEAYDRSFENGRAIVTVITEAAHADLAVSILHAHDALELDEYAGDTAMTALPTDEETLGGPTIPAMSAPSLAAETATINTPAIRVADQEETLSLAEEELEVGKRSIDRGTTRVRRYVIERPVEEQIRLRDEAISVFRRPATGRTVGPDAFTEKTIEMTETDEEAVVSKRARVVEEVVIHKEVGERVETVRATVRREEVDITGPGGRAVDPTTDRP